MTLVPNSSEITSLTLILGLYEYHWWANRRLLETSAALGEEAAQREMGTHFSESTVKGLFVHIYGFDLVWLARWRGSPRNTLTRDTDFASLTALRSAWDTLEASQRHFITTLTSNDLCRIVAYESTEGDPFRLPLWPLLQHVPNHATHHRSEIATMITMISGSPPPTDLVLYHLAHTQQTQWPPA